MPKPAYEAVPYEDRPVTETHLDTLYVAARRAGLPAARPEHARVLELGCAHAVNLVPMAFHLPGARFIGLDLSPGQIDRATRRIAGLGLRNLELRQADVLDVDLGDQRFDYVIAHGLYSWVPEPVRVRVLALCQAHLSDAGVAYLSYNAMPAWGIRGAVREALLQAVDLAAEPPVQLRCAREALAQLERIQPLRGTAEGALLAAELEGLRDKPDAYLLHEYLVPESRAFWLREVIERADQAGLRWLGDVAPSGLPPQARRATREALHALSNDPLALEQLADVVEFRQFRASLLVLAHAPLTLGRNPASLVLEGHLAAPPEPGRPDDDSSCDRSNESASVPPGSNESPSVPSGSNESASVPSGSNESPVPPGSHESPSVLLGSHESPSVPPGSNESPSVPAHSPAIEPPHRAAGPELAAAILRELRSCWPADLPTLELARALALEPTALVDTLWSLIDDERLHLRPRALPIAAPGPTPRVAELSRFEATHLPFVTNPRHEHAPLDAFHAALIRHLDGRPRAALVDALVDDILSGRLRLAAPTIPPLDHLRAALPRLIEAGLERLHAAALLLA